MDGETLPFLSAMLENLQLKMGNTARESGKYA